MISPLFLNRVAFLFAAGVSLGTLWAEEKKPFHFAHRGERMSLKRTHSSPSRVATKKESEGMSLTCV